MGKIYIQRKVARRVWKIMSWIIMLQTATPQTMILKGNWKEGHKGAMNYAAELYGIIEDLRKWNG